MLQDTNNRPEHIYSIFGSFVKEIRNDDKNTISEKIGRTVTEQLTQCSLIFEQKPEISPNIFPPIQKSFNIHHHHHHHHYTYHLWFPYFDRLNPLIDL